jgi:hypothetical protein
VKLNNYEQIIYSGACRSSLIFFWLPTKFKITNKRIVIESHNTNFGIFPSGHCSENYVYRNIDIVRSSSKLYFFRFFIGLFLCIDSFKPLLGPELYWYGIIEFLIGFLLLIHSYKSKLKITSNSGAITEIVVPIFESKKIKRVSREINKQLFY